MSTGEGFGLVASEAAIKRKPIVVSNVGGLPQQVIHGKTGYIVNNEEEAARYTIALLKNKNLREAFGTEARKYILSKFIIVSTLPSNVSCLQFAVLISA